MDSNVLENLAWPRMGSVPYPNTWDRFQGTRPMSNGQVPEFWIDDLTEDRDEEVLQHLSEHFLRDGVLARATELLQHPDAVREALALWRHMLRQRVSLVAMSTGDDGKPVVVGCNILSVQERHHEPLQASSVPLRTISEAMSCIEGRADVFTRFGVTRFLSALGLSVAPAFRAQGVGLRLLRARQPLCRALRLPLTATVFTGVAAQKLAARAGFQLLVEMPYAEYRDDQGQAVFELADGKSFMYMALPVEITDAKEKMATIWKRPATVPLPTTWARFRGLRPMANGRVPEFRVQDVPDDMLDAALDFMYIHFTRDSAFSRALNLPEDAVALEELRVSWRRLLDRRISLVALTDGEDGKSVIVGCNILFVVGRDDPPEPRARGRASRIIQEALETQERRANVLGLWGEPHALCGSGLLVHSDVRGQGVGLELLKARDPLCRALGLRLSYTVFNTAAVQALAERAGFRSVDEQSYEDYRDAEGNAVLICEGERCFKLMVKEIPPEVTDVENKMASGGWKRPGHVLIPTTWARFRGLKPTADGRVPEFWVQDVPDNMLEEVLDFVCAHFTQESAFSRALNILEDPVSLEETRSNWQRHLETRVSLVALTDGEDKKPKIAGCSILLVVGTDDPPSLKARGRARRIIDEALAEQDRRADVLNRCGESHALYGSGLLVHPSFRGQGVGLELLKARDPLCRAVGLRLSYTVFGGAASQTLAERAGFCTADEQTFADYRDAEGRAVLAGARERSFKLMVKKIPPEHSIDRPRI